jgi:hypothetical protein
MLSDREKRQLAEVFASVLRPFIDELKQEIVAACVEILDQQANDFAQVMQAQADSTVGEIKERAERFRREQERDHNRTCDLMMEALER